MEGFKATINHWAIRQEGEYYFVWGCTGEEFTSWNSIRTSYLELINLKDGWVKTRNNFYKLGTQLAT